MSFVKVNLVLKTDRPTDRQTDRPKYRSDLPSLKKFNYMNLKYKNFVLDPVF